MTKYNVKFEATFPANKVKSGTLVVEADNLEDAYDYAKSVVPGTMITSIGEVIG